MRTIKFRGKDIENGNIHDNHKPEKRKNRKNNERVY